MSRVGKNIWFTEIDDCSEICHLKELYRKQEKMKALFSKDLHL